MCTRSPTLSAIRGSTRARSHSFAKCAINASVAVPTWSNICRFIAIRYVTAQLPPLLRPRPLYCSEANLRLCFCWIGQAPTISVLLWRVSNFDRHAGYSSRLNSWDKANWDRIDSENYNKILESWFENDFSTTPEIFKKRFQYERQNWYSHMK